jgi:DNA invertase Pin-like site-specific DNA recombinase
MTSKRRRPSEAPGRGDQADRDTDRQGATSDKGTDRQGDPSDKGTDRQGAPSDKDTDRQGHASDSGGDRRRQRQERRRAFAYIRFSDPQQRKGNSLARQIREARQWCQSNGAVLDESLDFLRELGHSAFRGRNLEAGGGLGMFIAAVESGAIPAGSLLLVERLDRFSRTDVDVAFSFFGRVLRAGIDIVSIRSGQTYTAEMLQRQPMFIMGAILELILSNEESIKKSDRLLSVWAHKREQARKGVPQTKRGPLWLRLSRDRRKWHVIEERAEVVRRIFAETAAGVGAYRLAALLNAERIAPFEHREEWSQKSVHRVLVNRAALGEFQPRRKAAGKLVPAGEAVKDFFPRVITDVEWYAAHRQMAGRRAGGRKAGGRSGMVSIFQKLAFDHDGSSLVVRSTKGGNGYIKYLVNSSGLRGAERRTVPLDAFETTLLRGLGEIKPAEVAPPAGALEATLAAAKAHVGNLSARIDAATAALREQPPELIGNVVAQVAAWTQERREWVAQVQELGAKVNDSDPVTEYKDALAMLEQGGEAGRLKLRAAIRAWVKRVTVVIKPGKTRLEKRVGALVEFADCPEARAFFFTVPGGCSVVIKGLTAEELAARV